MYKYIDMSIFRPINSDESNLFIIRCVVSFSSQFDSTNIIAGGNNISKNVDLLIAPTSNNLPDNFGIYYTSNVFHVKYGKSFTSCPSVSIIPRLNELEKLTSNDSEDNHIITNIFWKTLEDLTFFDSSNFNFAFSFRARDGSIITPSNSSIVNGFDLIIIGAVKLGVTTGNSNKGWSIGAGNDANSTYSFMNVGIGTGNPSSALHVQGRLDSFLKKSNIPTEIQLTGNRVLTGDEILGDILNISSSNGDYILTTRTAEEIISDILSIKFHKAEVNDSFNLIIVNSSSNTITLLSGSNVTILGNNVISSSETSTFKFIITGSSSVSIVKI